ncbi:hypothetical protein [Wolbachia endosymbiont (group A) of Anomoia purmunda]|uniref:hypothetical protein n=1 Tax=Wolbachia endosymbiont (group A) of Anomoia purmunda TaxID=2953978 RepID=UPI0022300847|nr:hypothetical protein [Wolbachia endosymbiont (group A) of Anomoia purmunda]
MPKHNWSYMQNRSQCSFLVIPVLDTGIQESLLVSKQTSIESGYNIFDEIIWKTGFQCQALE